MKTRKKVLNILIAGLILYGFSACGSGLGEIGLEDPATSKELIAFSFNAAANTELSADVIGAISGTTIMATVPFGTDVTALVTTFITTGVSVKVGGIVQASGITANDFTGSVTYTVTAEDLSTQDYTITVGNLANHIVGSVSFNMVYVPGMSFPIALDDSGTATVTNAYLIGETEVTYELWYTVYDWAVNGTGSGTGEGQYIFANAGREGNDGIIGAVPTVNQEEPVTTINWRDAMVWMNALTEYYNAQNSANLVSVYYTDDGYITPIRTATDTWSIDTTLGSEDAPYVNPSANGFRLSTSDEWELAARYKGTDSANGAIEYPASSGNWWTPGDYASGATADYNNGPATELVAVYDENGDGSVDDSTAIVGSKKANALGLYDMSGNVREWSFEWSTGGSFRVLRGGGFGSPADNVQVGRVVSLVPSSGSGSVGFRLSRVP